MDKDQESSVQQGFEDHIKSIHDNMFLLEKEYGSYKYEMIEHMWQGWKAAHSKYQQDVVVDIGAIVFPDECGLVVDFWELRDVLDKAGVEYK